MKLQKHRAGKYKGKTIYKWTIVISPKDIEELGWKEGEELEDIAIKNRGYFLFPR